MIEEKSDFQKELDNLLAKEKTARMNNDNNESVRILKQIGKICYEVGDLDKLNEQLIQLCKKRGQPKKAQIELVQQCMTYVNQIQDLAQKIKLIEAIKVVSEKKIYLEVEYARCILMIVKFKENDNEILEASKILQEVQVETYGSMDKREKLEFILYQMKIMIKKLDYTRLFIISKKIESKNLQDEKIHDLKILYYSYLIFYYLHEGKYVEVADSYGKILETLHKNKELQDKLPHHIDFNFNVTFTNIIENYILFLAISPSSEQKLKALQDAKDNYYYALENQPFLLHIIKSFLSEELISTDVSTYGAQHAEIFSAKYEKHDDRLSDFKKQLIQHDLRVFQKYYKSIYLKRMSELIQIEVQEIEEEICEMIDSKLLVCRIDRMTGVAEFQLKKNENQVLDEWSQNINEVLKMVELTSNYIKREEELYL